MKLHLTQAAGNQLITGYGTGWVAVNETRHTGSLIVLPNRLIADWPVKRVDELTAEHFVEIADLQPEIVLLGTGATQRFVHPRLSRPLLEAGVGLECMDTAAACRTYNILMAEGRHVLAALLMATEHSR